MMNHWIQGWISWAARMDWIDLWNLWEEIPRKTISPFIFHAKISINLIRSADPPQNHLKPWWSRAQGFLVGNA